MKEPSMMKEEIKEIIEEGRIEDVRDFLAEQDPYDVAEYIEELEPRQIARIIHILGDPLGPDAFQKLDIEIQVDALQVMPRLDGARLIERMDPDERVDLIKALPDEVAERILPLIAQAKRNEIAKLVTYEEGTAGSVTAYRIVLEFGGPLPNHHSSRAESYRFSPPTISVISRTCPSLVSPATTTTPVFQPL